MFEYVVYGLAISSDTTLRQLQQREKPGDTGRYPRVRLRLKPSKQKRVRAPEWFHTYTTESGKPVLRQAKVAGGYLLSFPELADFFVAQDGREVECCRPYAHGSVETICHLALDQVLPCVANVNGLLALHATAVMTQHGLCAFVGAAGTGKSTIAASFALAGSPTFCDDCLVLVESGGGLVAEPGYPGVRLWEDSTRSILGERADDHGFVGHYTSKRGIERLGESKPSRMKATPLAAIYVLIRDGESGAAPRIDEISARDGFARMLRSTYRLDMTDSAMLSREFEALHTLIERVPVRRLHIASDFEALPAAREAVLADLAGIRS